MSNYYKNYFESFSTDFSVSHKISSETEKRKFHMHKQYEILYTMSDNLNCRTQYGTFSIPSKTFVLINTMELHYIFSNDTQEVCNRYVLFFSSSFVSSMITPELNLLACFQPAPDYRPVMFTVDEISHVNYQNIINKMIEYQDLANRDSNAEKRFYHIMHVRFLLGELLLHMHQLYGQKYGNSISGIHQSHSEQVMDICNYIQSHIQDDLTTDLLAKEFHISKTQLYYLFKEAIGMTAIDLLNESRISCAKNYLLNSDYSIEMISELAGYHTLSVFSRGFKLATGLSPQQYRKEKTDRKKK